MAPAMGAVEGAGALGTSCGREGKTVGAEAGTPSFPCICWAPKGSVTDTGGVAG